jgi:acyl-homoserine lactone acylase PvdQ
LRSCPPGAEVQGKIKIVPVADHVTIANPSAGFLVNNNSSPDSINNSVRCKDLPWSNGLWTLPAACQTLNPGERLGGYRNQVVRNWLDAAPPASVKPEDSRALAFDNSVVPWPEFRAILERIVQEQPEINDDPEVKAAVGALLAWDGRITKESVAALIFAGWVGRLISHKLVNYHAPKAAAELTVDELTAYRQALDQPLTSGCTEVKSAACCNVGVVPYLAQIVGPKRFGSASALIPWGQVHQLRMPKEGADRLRPLSSGDSMLQTIYMHTASKACPDFGMGEVESGSSFMMQVVYGPSGMEVNSVKPISNLADPNDPKYGKMSDLFAQPAFRKVELSGPGAGDLMLDVTSN